jgi:hypothetical protein
MASKLKRTTVKRKRRNSKKTRRFRQRGGVFEDQQPGEIYSDYVQRIFREIANDDRMFRLINMAKLNLLRDYKKKFWPEQIQQARNLIEFFKKVKKDLDGGTNEYREVWIGDYTNPIPIPVKSLDANQDRRINLAIEAINYVKNSKDIIDKLAEEINNKLENDTGKDELKDLFNGDNIIKLCKLDKAIRQAFINKGLVKNGKFYGYSIVDSPKA